MRSPVVVEDPTPNIIYRVLLNLRVYLPATCRVLLVQIDLGQPPLQNDAFAPLACLCKPGAILCVSLGFRTIDATTTNGRIEVVVLVVFDKITFEIDIAHNKANVL